MKRLLLLAVSLLAVLGAGADATLMELQLKSGGTVSYAFADNPVVTYTEDRLVLTTDKVTVEYPLADLEKMTFSDTQSAVESVTMSQPGDSDGTVRIYSLTGTLVRTIEQAEGADDVQFTTIDLPEGTYIIKQGKQTYKIRKQ